MSAVKARLIDELRFAPEDEPLVRALVDGALVVTDLDSAWRVQAALATPVPVVTLDGTVLHADGRVSGGTGEELAAGMLESKREARELSSDLRLLDVRVTDLIAKHQGLRARLVAAQARLDATRRKAHADELSLVSAEKDLRAVHAQQQNLLQRVERVRVELDELRDIAAEADDEKATATEGLGQARRDLTDVTARIEAGEAAVAGWRVELDAARADLTEHRVRIAGIRERLGAAKGTMGRLARSTDELEARAVRLEEERTANAASFGETAASLLGHCESRGVALDRARARSEALAAARAVFEQHRSELVRREAGLKGLRARVDEVRDVLAKHELALREQQLTLQHLLDGVAERFRGLSLPRVVGDYHIAHATRRRDPRAHAGAREPHRAHGERQPRRGSGARRGRETLYLLQRAEGGPRQGAGRPRARHRPDEPRVEETVRRDVRRGEPEVPGGLPADVPRWHGVAAADQPRRHARDRHRHPRAATRQASSRASSSCRAGRRP